MKDGFDDLLSEIVSLASPSQTLILIADTGTPARFVDEWKEDGTFELMREHAYEVWRRYMLRAASRHGVHVVRTFEVINGPDGDQPPPSEWRQSDGLHFSSRGHRAVADLHREVGYAYSTP